MWGSGDGNKLGARGWRCCWERSRAQSSSRASPRAADGSMEVKWAIRSNNHEENGNRYGSNEAGDNLGNSSRRVVL